MSMNINQECDVIVIGSGVAGLSCAALLATAGKHVRVLESHDAPGGCAHGWQRLGYHFESGPSLYSGFTPGQGEESTNPLYNIFRIIGESPEWIQYDRWGTCLPNTPPFAAKQGPVEFRAVLEKYGGVEGVREWDLIIAELLKPEGVAEASQAISPLLLREDAGIVVTLLRNFRGLKLAVKHGAALNAPFIDLVKKLELKNAFVLNWLNLLTFLLQGLPSEGTMMAVIAYMMKDWYRPGVCLDFPRGGSGEIVAALVRGVEKGKVLGYSGTNSNPNRSSVETNRHVDEIIVRDGRAVGVKVRNTRTGVVEEILAKTAVVCNADLRVLRKILPRGAHAKMDQHLDTLTADIPLLPSFIHLHAGIDASALPKEASEALPAQWVVVDSWERGVEAPRNVVLVSVPSLLDPSLAPTGKHIIHAYTPATELYTDWQHLDRASDEYKAKKAEAATFLWDAVEKYIPNARNLSDKRCEQLGTPLTHERFLRRAGGSYGPRIVAGTAPTLPGHKTPLKGLYMCGDFSFPGIGIPAAAASGAVTAHTILPLGQHLSLLKKIGL